MGRGWIGREVIVVSGRSITRLAGRAIAVITTASTRAIGEWGGRTVRAFSHHGDGLRDRLGEKNHARPSIGQQVTDGADGVLE